MDATAFWDALKTEYEVLARQSFIGERRYNVHPGEVRDRMCSTHGISRQRFRRLLTELHESREHYQELELIGAPPHAAARFQRNGMAMQIGGVWYSYIVLHISSK